MEIDKKEVGQRIYAIRKKFGYSMEKFGAMLDDAPKGSVNSWEKGVNLPNETRLHMIASLGNISRDELVYGSFESYVSRLIMEQFGEDWSQNDGFDLIMTFLNNYGYTYGDDKQIMEVIHTVYAYLMAISKELTIFYQPTAYSLDFKFFDGVILKEDSKSLVCRAYAEKDKNTLHILPDWDDELTSVNKQFFSYAKRLAEPHFHKYFTFGMPMLSLTLENSKFIYYGIDETDYSVQIMPYEFDEASNSYKLNKKMTYTVLPRFYREVEKESLYRKFKAGKL